MGTVKGVLNLVANERLQRENKGFKIVREEIESISHNRKNHASMRHLRYLISKTGYESQRIIEQVYLDELIEAYMESGSSILSKSIRPREISRAEEGVPFRYILVWYQKGRGDRQEINFQGYEAHNKALYKVFCLKSRGVDTKDIYWVEDMDNIYDVDDLIEMDYQKTVEPQLIDG